MCYYCHTLKYNPSAADHRSSRCRDRSNTYSQIPMERRMYDRGQRVPDGGDVPADTRPIPTIDHGGLNINRIECYMGSCVQTFGSNKYDLNRLNNFTLYDADSQSRYFLTPCNNLPSSPCYTNASTNAISCVYQHEFQSWSTMAYLDMKSPTHRNNNATYQENPSGPGTGIVMETSNGDICFDELRFMTTTFICDETVSHPTTMKVVQLAQCRFTAEVRAMQACPLE